MYVMTLIESSSFASNLMSSYERSTIIILNEMAYRPNIGSSFFGENCAYVLQINLFDDEFSTLCVEILELTQRYYGFVECNRSIAGSRT